MRVPTVQADAHHIQPFAFAGRRPVTDRTVTLRVPRWRTAAMAALYATSLSVAAVSPALAQGLPLIRDTEIENVLKDYSKPIFKAAGLSANNISIRIVREQSFNAFVLDGRHVYINTGTLMQAKTPNEVIGVLAHETGHIVGGHLAALRSRISHDATKSLLLTVLGIGMIVAGAASGGDARDIGTAGTGVMMGGNEMIMRSILSERRAQESSADQAGLRFLEATKQSGRGMLETFERFAQQEYISATYQDPFVRSHPVAANRLAQLRDRVNNSRYASVTDPPQLQLRHDMIRAKLSGYLEPVQTVMNRYPASDNSLPARYARAIARNCSGKCTQAIGEVDALLREQPNNPYFWELKGNLYYWNGKYEQAIPALRKSLALVGNDESLIQAELAQTLLATESPAVLNEAVALLRRSILLDDAYSTAHHQLAQAFYKQGKFPQADLAAAQAHFVEGNVKQAKIFAKRALAKLPRGSPEWIRAEDIINYKEQT
jgi:predicted Zn-dependent protease